MTSMPRDDFESELEARKRESTGQLLLRAARLFNERAIERVRARGPRLRTSHTALFPHVDLEGTRLTELAARMGVTKQAVGPLVAELEEQGVVRREADPTDGRAKLVRFTPRGERGLLHGLGKMHELEEELAGEIGREQMRRLHAALEKLLAVLERPS